MRPVSDAFLKTVRGSHEMAVRARLVTDFETGTSPDGDEIGVSDGDVTLDATAQVRGTLALTTDGTGWDPRPGKHPVQPYGTEVYVERGVKTGGSVAWVGQGYYKIQTVEQDEPGGTLAVTGSDRMQSIIDAQLPQPISFRATQTVQDVFLALITGVYPDAVTEFDYDAASDQLGSPQVTSSDRYGFLSDLATSRGKVFYWDYRGILVVADLPDGSGDPVEKVDAGPGGVLTSAKRTLTRDNVYNAVVVQGNGAGTSAPPLAVAYDNNPDSLTYYYGTYGQVPELWSSPVINTARQAESAARTRLIRDITLPFTCDWSSVPNPALEPLDVVRVRTDDRQSSDMLIDTLTIPLTPGGTLDGTAHDPGRLVIGTWTRGPE